MSAKTEESTNVKYLKIFPVSNLESSIIYVFAIVIYGLPCSLAKIYIIYLVIDV